MAKKAIPTNLPTNMNIAQRIVVNYLRARLNIMAVFSPRRAAISAYAIFSTPFRKSRKPAPPVFASCERLTMRIPSGNIIIYRWNHPAERRILILHGFESRAYNFDAYIKPLISAGFEVMALDAPAHGASEGKRLSLPDYVSAIQAVAGKFGPFHAYLGHSFGGLALGMYLESGPDLPPADAILIAPATETTTAIDTFFRFLQLGTDIRKPFDQYIRDLSGRDPEHFSLRRIIPGQYKHRFFWIHDQDDDLTPLSDVQPLMVQSPEHVRFMITEGLGHRKIYRDNKVRQEIMGFLNGREIPFHDQ
jgi:pimeloyl-ACP methyl ester carboxylesterase